MTATIDFRIQGRSHLMQVDVGDPVNSDISKALKNAGIAGDASEWTAHTEAGDALDGTKSLITQGIGGTTSLILTRGPGRGG